MVAFDVESRGIHRRMESGEEKTRVYLLSLWLTPL